MKKRMPIIAGILLMILGAGCGREQLPTQSSDYQGSISVDGGDGYLVAAEIVSAKLNFYAIVPNGQQTNAHSITAPWNAATVSWNSFAGNFSADVEGSATVGSPGWHSVDITGLVNAWANGTVDNYGVLLEQSVQAGAPVAMHSSESASQSPFLEICYPYSGNLVCDTIHPYADAFIDQFAPDASTGSNLTLLLGRMMMPNAEKQTLFQFVLPEIVYAVEYSAIGGSVWKDVDEDGILEGGETSFPGVRVKLYDCFDVLLDSAVTDAIGSYKFDSLAAGDYFVQFIAPEGYSFSPKDQSPSDVLDSDPDPATGKTDCFTLVEGEESLNWSAGLYESSEIDPGCTQPLRYWMRYVSGLRVRDMSDLLPIWLGANIGASSIKVESELDVYRVLRMRTYGNAMNGITRLYADMLVAKLNIASGADPADVAATISEADAFLGLNSWTKWRGLSWQQKRMIFKWSWMFQKYNNGVIGPGRCGGLGNGLGDKAMR